jgi:phospholipid-binding lipoprotein MlaA
MPITMKTCRAALLAVVATFTLAACSTAPVQKGDVIEEPLFTADRVLQEGVTYAADAYDPWEGFNRSIYRFNYRVDRYIFLPVVNAYQAVLPDFAETGIHNFFQNLRDLTTLMNSILQLSPDKSFDTTARVIVNSTVGLVGLIDVATALDIPRPEEDFGQTLGFWGVGNGPYLVLPVLGPSTVRDGVGAGVDWWVQTEFQETWGMDATERWALAFLYGVDTRANIAFRYYETGSPTEYELVRMLYLTKRKLDVER